MRFQRVSVFIFAFAVAGGCKLSVSDLVKGGGSKSEPAASNPSASGSDPGTPTASGDDDDDDDDDADATPSGADLTVDVVTVAAIDGVPKIGPTRPEWCDIPAVKENAGQYPNYTASHLQMALDNESRWGLYAYQAAKAACAAPDGKKMAIQTGHLLQLFANKTGVGPKILIPYIGYSVAEAWDTEEKAHCAKLAVSGEASKRDQLLGEGLRAAYGCTESYTSIDWEYDRVAAAPSEMLRALQVTRCLDVSEPKQTDAFQYSVCGHDARALDTKVLEKEIAGYSDWAKTVARYTHGHARYLATRAEAAARALAKEDAVWQQLIFDVPAKTWTAWEESYKADRAAIDAALAYEDVYTGPSKNAAKNCLPKAWPALQGYVSSRKASGLAGAKEALMTPVGNILVRQVASCLQAEGMTFAQYMFEEMRNGSPAGRGPRHAMSAAVADALMVIKSDREKFPADRTWFRHYVAGTSRDLLNRDLASMGGGSSDKGGIIKSVKKEGDNLRIEFKEEKIRERESWCEDTSKIIGWFSDGTPQYYRVCKEGGMVTVDLTHVPVLVPALMGGALEKGQFARFRTSGTPSEGETTRAIPVEIWANADKKELVGYAGLAL
jgi:hypothetical protein